MNSSHKTLSLEVPAYQPEHLALLREKAKERNITLFTTSLEIRSARQAGIMV